MIRVARRKAPRGFNEKVRRPGDLWLAKHPTSKKIPRYWLRVKAQVIAAFHQRCAYTAMWLSTDGEVDHFISLDEDRRKAFRWGNYRYAAPWLNRSKQHLRTSEMLDPFEVEDDWFELVIPSLELRITDRCPDEVRHRAEVMLDRLHLRNGEHVMRSRRAFYQQYRLGKVELEHLDDVAPLLARAIRKKAAAEPPK